MSKVWLSGSLQDRSIKSVFYLPLISLISLIFYFFGLIRAIRGKFFTLILQNPVEPKVYSLFIDN